MFRYLHTTFRKFPKSGQWSFIFLKLIIATCYKQRTLVQYVKYVSLSGLFVIIRVYNCSRSTLMECHNEGVMVWIYLLNWHALLGYPKLPLLNRKLKRIDSSQATEMLKVMRLLQPRLRWRGGSVTVYRAVWALDFTWSLTLSLLLECCRMDWGESEKSADLSEG